MAQTNFLKLLTSTIKDYYNVLTQQNENWEKIDNFIGALPSSLLTTAKTIVPSINELFTNKLDKGAGLKSTNARQLEEQIENLIVAGKLTIVGGGYYKKYENGILELSFPASIGINVTTEVEIPNFSFVNTDYIVKITDRVS